MIYRTRPQLITREADQAVPVHSSALIAGRARNEIRHFMERHDEGNILCFGASALAPAANQVDSVAADPMAAFVMIAPDTFEARLLKFAGKR